MDTANTTPDKLQAFEMQTAESGDPKRPAVIVPGALTPAVNIVKQHPAIWLAVGGIILYLFLKR